MILVVKGTWLHRKHAVVLSLLYGRKSDLTTMANTLIPALLTMQY